MKLNLLRTRLTWLLLVTLLLPILAACGGTAPAGTTTGEASVAASTGTTGGGTETSAAATTAASAEATTAASAEATTAASAEATAAASVAGGTGSDDTANFLVYGNPGEPDSIDAFQTTSGQALTVAEQIEETLVARGTSGDLEPLLAESWEANGDSTEWTFKLREGVKFHDGTDFNAEAVVFNFERAGNPTSEFGYRDQGKTYPIFGELFGGDMGDPASALKAVEAVDENTVRFVMSRPFPLLPELLSATYFSLSSPEAVKEAGANYGTPEGGAVGTGAFTFESWNAGENIILVRNEDYWGEKAKMPGAVVRFIADAPARFAELQAGSIDFTIGLAPDVRETIQGDANLTEPQVDPFNIAYLAMNVSDKPFDDVRVRQAIAHAINKQEILDAFYGGVGEVANTFLPEAMQEFRPTDAPVYEYDPEKAKALLAEAGFPNGFDTMTLSDGTQTALEFWYMPVSRPYYSTPKPVAEAFAAQLADVGIQVELKTEDWGVYLDNVDQAKKHGMWMLGWTGDYNDPNNFLYTFFGPSGQQQQGYNNPTIIEQLDEARGATSQEEAIKIFQQAQTLIAQEVPRIPIVHAPPVYAAKKALQGWQPSPFGHEPWKTISIEK